MTLRLFRAGIRVERSCSLRCHASYGARPLTHEGMMTKYHGRPTAKDELMLLEQTEDYISRWRLNKWEFRVPPLLSSHMKEKVMLQQDVLKSLILTISEERKSVERDIALLASLTGISPESVRGKTRAWLQEEASKLRWNGEVNKAREVRDAFLRLEIYGAKDHRILERLCCIYSLGLQGTFEEAFGNIVTQDSLTGKFSVDESNPFGELLSLIVTRYPHIDIIHDFQGFNVATGYRGSLRRFMAYCLGKKLKVDVPKGNERVVLHSVENREILFDFGNSKERITVDDSVYGLPDFMYINHSDIFLITIAAENHWLRNRQLPHSKQLEGIARRASFVVGAPFEKTRIRNILLPPNYVDKASLLRLTENVLSLSEDIVKEAVPWISVYEKELDSQDVDYCELQKTVNEEEWLTL